MSAVSILFPWQGTCKQLGLRKHWWHRLAVVALFVALLPVLCISWVLAFSSLQPAHSYMPEIQYWAMDTDGNPQQMTLGPPVTQAQYDAAMKKHAEDGNNSSIPIPVGFQTIIAPAGVSIDLQHAPLKATVDMPNGTTAEFVGKSDADITITWKNALRRAVFKAWLFSIGIAAASTLVFSYLFQSVYRALLYVVYGSTKEKEQT